MKGTDSRPKDATINVALIGHRYMGKAHTHAYTDVGIFFRPRLQPIRRVLCARPEDEDLPDVAAQWGWQEWDDNWRRVVERPDVDAIDVSAPSRVHKDIVLAAAAAGKHILCEKPLAMTLEDAREMLRAVEDAHVVHAIGFNYRKVPAIALAKQMIEQGELGEIRHFRGIYSQDWLVDPSFPATWRLRKSDAGAGASWDLGAHVVDLARFLVGEFDRVIGQARTFIAQRPEAVFEEGLHATAGTRMRAVDVDDAASFLAQFRNGALGIVESTRFATGRRNQNRIEVFGSEGGIAFDMERMNELEFFSKRDAPGLQGFRTIQVTGPEHPYMVGWWPAGHLIGFGDTFVHEILDFVNAIADDTQASPSFNDAVKCQEVLAAVDMSVETQRWVTMDEIG